MIREMELLDFLVFEAHYPDSHDITVQDKISATKCTKAKCTFTPLLAYQLIAVCVFFYTH